MEKLNALVKKAQEDLQQSNVDGWFVADFHGHNPIAQRFLDKKIFLSRRWAIWIPKNGQPVMVVNAIESKSLSSVEMPILTYRNFEEWCSILKQCVSSKHIYVEWFENGAIPYLSYLDGGLVDLLKSIGCRLESSGNISQRNLLLWSEKTISAHVEAANSLTSIVLGVLERVSKTKPFEIDESIVQGWLLEGFEKEGMVMDHPPVVAVNEHAGDPHYATPKKEGGKLGEDFILLVDLWGTKTTVGPAYADITWMAKRGKVKPIIDKGFYAVLEARDAGVQIIEEAFKKEKPILGFEVDKAVRDVIEKSGFGDGFIHRTGHNLGLTSAHGDAAQLDNYEAKDIRPLAPGWAGTIEPGVYYSEWGIRSEINLVLNPHPIVTTRRQKDWFIV